MDHRRLSYGAKSITLTFARKSLAGRCEAFALACATGSRRSAEPWMDGAKPSRRSSIHHETVFNMKRKRFESPSVAELRPSAERRLARRMPEDGGPDGKPARPGAKSGRELPPGRTAIVSGLARYADLYERAPVGYFTLDRNGAIIQANLSGAKLLGVSRAELKRRRFEAFLCETSRPVFGKLLAEVFADPAKQVGELRLKSSAAVHVEAVADAKKRECRLAVTDISARKRIEEELQLSALVYQSINEAIVVADADNRIVAINPAFTRMTGYTEEDAIGQPTSLLKSGRQSAEFYQQMWAALDSSGCWQGEIWNRRKNGEVYVEWLSISTIYGTDGEVLRRVAMFFDLTEQKRNEALIWRQANYDPLTDLPNRNLFYDRLQQKLKSTRREDHRLALLFIDLDHFKEVNDTLGHQYGDQLLVQVARRISACIREADTLARLGGDEFTAILGGLGEASRIEGVAQQIIEAVGHPYQLGTEVAQVSASIGITLYPSDATDVETLIKNADQAMYAAKAQGRNRFSYFTAAMEQAAQERRQLGQDLRGAIRAGQFMVYYQPIIELATGRIVKAEALPRWRHPSRGLIEPAEFIPLAEESGLINEVGDWVFKQAARQAKLWQGLCADAMQISVNKSPRQFFECTLKESWIDFLREIQLPAACINIDIAESLLLDDRPAVAAALLRFRDANIQVTLDDFGVGHSSLSDLKKFHIDYLKIDQSFVWGMVDDPGDRAIVEGIIAMAHKLGIKVIAEGVESAGQRDLLAEVGCDFGQGYWFAKPMPAQEMAALLSGRVAEAWAA
jgi:diguanylate cyclase (GGDEF)-like protein/PAS domain S-box-containing protein